MYRDILGALSNRDHLGLISPIIVVENHSHQTLTSAISNLEFRSL
ncbi:hypothetical protein D1AOALGA4SA_9363 [Olavius algarvensis Delta 1 endosymbiont]|nr:hypothetical protein D1AOALGA4SA_9363 [Olavius algarvensis Delta 1 endosymbiont]